MVVNPSIVISADYAPPAQLAAEYRAKGVAAVVTILSPVKGKRCRGVSLNHSQLVRTLTSGKHALPEELRALVVAAAEGTLPKGSTIVRGAHVPDLAVAVMGWGAALLVAREADRSFYFNFLKSARKAWGN